MDVTAWSLSALAAGDEERLSALRLRLKEDGVPLLIDVSAPERALAAIARLLSDDHPVAPWIALLPAGCPETADIWWQRGAFDALTCDDPNLQRSVHRARAHSRHTSARWDRLQARLLALQASLDNIPAPIFAKNAQGRYTHCNHAFTDYLGLPRERIVGKTVHEVAPGPLAHVYDQADRQLLSSGGRQVYEAQVKWADGSLHDVIFHKAAFVDVPGEVAGLAGAIFDITDRKRLEHGLRELAETDPLTGLLNRRCFIERAGLALLEARVHQSPLTVLLIDVDHFKQINDNLGHAAGDRVLLHLARWICDQLPQGAVFARIGGDEFAALITGETAARALADRLPADTAAQRLSFEEQELSYGISVGAAVVVADDHDIDSALRQADAALYEAKRRGRGRTVVFDHAL